MLLFNDSYMIFSSIAFAIFLVCAAINHTMGKCMHAYRIMKQIVTTKLLNLKTRFSNITFFEMDP